MKTIIIKLEDFNKELFIETMALFQTLDNHYIDGDTQSVVISGVLF